jgi:hypothetical protein
MTGSIAASHAEFQQIGCIRCRINPKRRRGLLYLQSAMSLSDAETPESEKT